MKARGGRKPKKLTTEQALERASDEFQYLTARLENPTGLSSGRLSNYLKRWARAVDDLVVLNARPKLILHEEEVKSRADMLRLMERISTKK